MSSIKRRPDGKWRARYRDDQGKEHARHFDRKIDAQAWLDEVTTSIVTGMYVDPNAGKITFDQFYKQWAERQSWVRSTEINMAVTMRSVEFGKTPLRTIRRSHIETWVKTMNTTSLAASTISARYVNLRAVFRAAVKDRLIAVNPTDDIALPRKRRASAAMRLPTTAEVKRLLDAASDEFGTFMALGAFAGLRVGEICGLQLGDIDFLGRSLAVVRQIQRGPAGAREVFPPKYGSERTVYLPDGVVKTLSRHVATKGRTDPTEWLFQHRQGEAWLHTTVTPIWRRTADAAKVEGIRFHDLRHFYASGLIAAGCDVVTVQRALGHSSATTTLGTYSHLWPSAEDRTRQAASGLLSDVVGSVADSLRTWGG